MPGRYIREGILTSEKVNQLSETAEVFYRRLLNVVDDYGRFYANVLQLFCNCYPLKLHSLNDREQTAYFKKIEKSLAECQRADLLIIYGNGNGKYLQLKNFGQKARSKSKFPEPTEAELNNCKTLAKQPLNNCKTDDKQLFSLNDNVNGNVNDNEYGEKRKRFTPPSFDEVYNYLRERYDKGIYSWGVNEELWRRAAEHFIDYYSARDWKFKGGQKMKDWKAAVRTWEKNGFYKVEEVE